LFTITGGGTWVVFAVLRVALSGEASTGGIGLFSGFVGAAPTSFFGFLPCFFTAVSALARRSPASLPEVLAFAGAGLDAFADNSGTTGLVAEAADAGVVRVRMALAFVPLAGFGLRIAFMLVPSSQSPNNYAASFEVAPDAQHVNNWRLSRFGHNRSLLILRTNDQKGACHLTRDGTIR
jgi:hypothetical protein